MSEYQNNYIAVLGAVAVGKSAIVQRILNNSFTGRYQETVDDLYSSEFRFAGESCVGILDTAGGTEFPALRSQAISNARGFILVYSITDNSSYMEMQNLWQQIKTQRYDYSKIPCVIVGNKLDKENKRQVTFSEAQEWTGSEGLDGKLLEASAKENRTVGEILKVLSLNDV